MLQMPFWVDSSLKISKMSKNAFWPKAPGVKGLKLTKTVSLTNRRHVAVRLFSNRSQNKNKNKRVTHEAIAKCVTDVLTTF